MDQKREWLKVTHSVEAHTDSELPDSEYIDESESSIAEADPLMLIPEQALLECPSAFTRQISK